MYNLNELQTYIINNISKVTKAVYFIARHLYVIKM